MTVRCSYDPHTREISADFNNVSLVVVKVPVGVRRSTIEKIMKAISGLPSTTRSVELIVSNGKLMMKVKYWENQKNSPYPEQSDSGKADSENADSGNASDAGNKENKASGKNDSPTAKISSKDNQKAFKIGVNISHGLSAIPIPKLDFDKPENTGKRNKKGSRQDLVEPSYGYIANNADFINDGLDDSDIQQKVLGDCWFLAPLASLANDDQKSAVYRRIRDKVIMPSENNAAMKSDRKFTFNFFRMGEWYQIEVDDKLPWRRRSAPSKSFEWWVPLLEKAYATFNGSYSNINGGSIGWGLTELTGGITTRIRLNYDYIESSGLEKFENFFRKYFNKNSICSAENHIADGAQTSGIEDHEMNGLVTRHAYTYSILGLLDVKTPERKETIIRLRNPWGSFEWKGQWSDNSDKWNHVDEDLRVKDKDDGLFYMSLVDFIKQFEVLGLCHIDFSKDNDQRVIGKLTPGENAIYLKPQMQLSEYKERVKTENLQISLEVNEEQDVWIQMLQETHDPKELSFITLTVCQPYSLTSKRINFGVIPDGFLTIIPPFMPLVSPQKDFDEYHQYDHNGFCFRLKPGKYLIFAAYTVPSERHYMIRVVGNELSLKMLE